MTHDDDDDLLAGVDLERWRVPPPPDLRDAILLRSLAPAPKRRRVGWLIAAVVLANAAIAAIIAIVISGSPTRITELRPAGNPVDPNIQEILRRLDEEHRQLEQRLAEVEELRTLVKQLAERLDRFELRTKLQPTARKDHDAVSSETASCDEVSCVLDDYRGACCAKLRREGVAPPPKSALPEALDRAMIATGIQAVRAQVDSCRTSSSAKGKVKVTIRVDFSGSVTEVVVLTTPDAGLGSCVASAVAKAKFDKTRTGGSFSYPFVF